MSVKSPAGTIVAVAHDAGGARALQPVVAELRQRGQPVIGLAAGPAISVWTGESSFTHVEKAADEMAEAAISSFLQQQNCVLLLSAAGLYNQIEHTARLAAKGLALPIVAVLDSWFNYRERFERTQAGKLSTSPPDTVCVIDALTQQEMQRAGFPNVILTGHPDMERTIRLLRQAPQEKALQWRAQAGISPESLLLTFFSDPFFTGPNRAFYSGPGAIMRPDGQGLYGYTVEDVLPKFLSALDEALAKAGTTEVELVIRPHPSEHEAVLQGILASYEPTHYRVRLTREGTSLDWITASDAVVGMMTIALLQAALAGKPSISLEPGLLASGEPDPCMSNTLGYTLGVFDQEGIPVICQQLAARDWPRLRSIPQHELPLEGATHRVADVVCRLIS